MLLLKTYIINYLYSNYKLKRKLTWLAFLLMTVISSKLKFYNYLDNIIYFNIKLIFL